MAGVKISALPAASNFFDDTDLVAVVDVSSVQTQKATIAQLRGGLSAPSALAGEALVAGNVACKANDAGTAKLYKADANAAGRKVPIGYITAAASAGANAQIQQFGTIDVPNALWDAVPAAADAGAVVYMSATAGNSTLTAPTGTAGNALVATGTVWSIGAGFVTVLIDIGLPGGTA